MKTSYPNKLRYSFLTLPPLVFSIVLASGCAQNPDIVFSPEPVQIPPPVEKADKANTQAQSSEDINTFVKLPRKKIVKNSFEIGKKDPFSQFTNDKIELIAKNLRLNGIISDGKDNIALVQYLDERGELRKGQTGGLSTSLLPNGITVDKIDMDKESLILRQGNSILEIKLYGNI